MKIIRGTIKFIAKPFWNVRKNSDYDRYAKSGRSLKEEIKRLFIPQKAEFTEEFSSAMRRFQLTEQDIQARQRGYHYMALFLIVAAMLLIAFGLFHLTNGGWQGSLVSVGIAMGLIGFAFKYHFWSFQMKKHKLGCTFKEWWQEGLLGRKQ